MSFPNAPNVPLNALRTFDAAARRSSFTDAAGELHVSQAAVSQQIRTLESQLGIRLFERTSKGLSLTPLGRDLALATRSALTTIDDSIGRITGAAGAGTLTISTLPSFASRWLVPRLGGFQAACPGIEVHLHTAPDRVDLLGSRIDAAIRLAAIDEPGLVTVPLMADGFCLVATPAFAERIGDDVDALHDHTLAVDNARLLDVPSSGLTGEATERAIDALGLDRSRLRLRVFSTSENVIQSALVGEAAALTRVSLCVDELEAGRLVRLFGFAHPLAYGTSLVHAETRSRDPDLQRFRDWIVAEAAGFSERLARYLR